MVRLPLDVTLSRLFRRCDFPFSKILHFFFFFLNSFLISFRPCVIAVSSGRPFHQPEIKERRRGSGRPARANLPPPFLSPHPIPKKKNQTHHPHPTLGGPRRPHTLSRAPRTPRLPSSPLFARRPGILRLLSACFWGDFAFSGRSLPRPFFVFFCHPLLFFCPAEVSVPEALRWPDGL